MKRSLSILVAFIMVITAFCLAPVPTEATLSGYNVVITAGAEMTKQSGDENQTVNAGEAITNVVYEADTCCFPETYGSLGTVNGITVTRTNATTITVSGTPTADTNITLAALSGHIPEESVKENEIPPSCAGSGSYEEVIYCSICGAELSRESKTGVPGDTLTIGELSQTGNDSYLPMNSLYNYSYSQQIYTAAEIGASCTVTSVTLWLYGNENLYEMPFDIYMLETDKNSFDSAIDWIPVTEADKVYSGSVTVHNTDAEAFTFTLDTPFAYSGNGNLVLCVDNNTGFWKSGLNGKVFGSDTDPVRAIYARNDQTNYSPLDMSGIGATGTTYRRNVIELGITPAASSYPHSLSLVPAVPAGCTENGKAKYYHCSVCNKDFEDSDGNTEITDITAWGIIAPLGHCYSSTVTPPSCTEGGYTTFTCSNCSDSYTTDETEPLGHDWGDWTLTTPAGETTPGVETRVCSRDASHTQTRPVDPTGHKLTLVQAKDPTETEPGNKAYYTCSGCDKIFEDEAGLTEITDKTSVVIPATGAPAVVNYTIADGENYTKESDTALTFTSDADFAKFVSVKVDGVIIDSTNYTAVSDNTKVTLKAAYLETLSVGTHTLTIVFNDGEASAQFTVLAANNDSQTQPQPSSDKTSPQTGDNSHFGLWFTLMILVLCALTATIFIGKKKRASDR